MGETTTKSMENEKKEVDNTEGICSTSSIVV